MRVMAVLPVASCSLFLSVVASAGATVDLVFAQRPSSLAVQESEIDDIIRRLNDAVQRADSKADVACDITFVRTKPLIWNDQLPSSGDWTAHKAALQKLAPSADFLIVTSLSCSTTPSAAGCAAKGKPASVTYKGADKARTSIVWGHEQGHRRGLPHVTADAQRTNIMYWNPQADSRLLTGADCQAFGGAVRAGADARLADLLTVAERSGEADFGLTPSALALLQDGWTERLPLERIRALGPDDRMSLLQVFDHQEAHALWADALVVLGVLADDRAVEAIRHLLETPMPDLTDAPADDDRRAYARDLLKAKLTAPIAAGFLLNRTPRNTELAELLASGIEEEQSRKVATPEFASDYEKATVYGLAYSGMLHFGEVAALGDERSKRRMASVLAGIAPEELAAINEISEEARGGGLDRLLERSPQPVE